MPQFGILSRSEVGFLVWDECPDGKVEESRQPGSRLKTPLLPVWVSLCTGHYRVLFNTNQELLRNYHAERRWLDALSLCGCRCLWRVKNSSVCRCRLMPTVSNHCPLNWCKLQEADDSWTWHEYLSQDSWLMLNTIVEILLWHVFWRQNFEASSDSCF
jgi:hypothetical protein